RCDERRIVGESEPNRSGASAQYKRPKLEAEAGGTSPATRSSSSRDATKSRARQFGFTNRPTMPAEPLARDGEPVGTILAVTSSLVRPGARSVGSRSVAISTKV